MPAIKGERPTEKFVLEGTQESGDREGALCLFQAPSGSGKEVGWVGLPCGPGSAEDTGLNVGSHDVTSDIKVDADEFALPTGKHSLRSVPGPQPLTYPCRQVGKEMAGSVWGEETPQAHSLTGQLVKRNHCLQAGSI